MCLSFILITINIISNYYLSFLMINIIAKNWDITICEKKLSPRDKSGWPLLISLPDKCYNALYRRRFAGCTCDFNPRRSLNPAIKSGQSARASSTLILLTKAACSSPFCWRPTNKQIFLRMKSVLKNVFPT